MVLSDRLRFFREQRSLSQADMERRAGLLRYYISRVENGHTVPTIETLEKMARAMDMQLYQLLYDGPGTPELPKPVGSKARGWGSSGKDARFLAKLRRWLSKMTPRDRRILMAAVSEISKQKVSS